MPGSGEGRGQEPVVLNRIKALDTEKHQVTLLCLQKNNQSNSFIEKIKSHHPRVKIEVIYIKKTILTLISMLTNVINGRPIQNALFINKALKNSYEAHMRDNKHFIFITSRAYPVNMHIKNFSLDFIDSLALNFLRKSEVNNYLLKIILEKEAKRLKKLETYLAHQSKNAFCVSKIDADYICKDKVKFLPLGVSNEFFNTEPQKKIYDIVFFGNLFYEPNFMAIDYFVSSILPHIRSQQEVSVLIAGRNPHLKIIHLAEKQNILIIKNPLSMAEILAKCKVSIAPMLSGSGMQNKILESMAAGVPVVCNKLGLGTIGAKNGEDIIVEDNPDGFAIELLKLLNDKEHLQKISLNGKKYVLQNHNWKEINKKYSSYFE